MAARRTRSLAVLLWVAVAACGRAPGRTWRHRAIAHGRRQRCLAALAMVNKEQADAESDARLMAALFPDREENEGAGADPELGVAAMWDAIEEDTKQIEKSTEIASHQQLDLDEDGQPLLLRFAYVDETTCIGCTYCADVARNTFYMNEDAGRARVFAQGGDDPEVVLEAIDSCPVNCISFVDLEDLVILETEREGMVINPMSIGVPATWSARMNALPPTEAKMGRGASNAPMCCNNCPSRGCKECPMYGVGLNPIYLQRLEEREAKRAQSGAAQQEDKDAERAAAIDALFAEPQVFLDEGPLPDSFVGVVEPTLGANGKPVPGSIPVT